MQALNIGHNGRLKAMLLVVSFVAVGATSGLAGGYWARSAGHATGSAPAPASTQAAPVGHSSVGVPPECRRFGGPAC
jgi:hypothetical protein